MKKYIKADITDTSEESYDTRCEIARDPNTRPAVLAKLAHDESPQVRCYVARNPSTHSNDLLY